VRGRFVVCGLIPCNEGTTILIGKRQHDCLCELKKNKNDYCSGRSELKEQKHNREHGRNKGRRGS
jgi:hypothetical protein